MAALPHHADMVGSLLRPAALTAARAEWREGRLDADELRRLEDDAIADLVRQQEAIGMPAVTDGEFRRDWWHLDFLLGLGGIGSQQRERPKDFSGDGESPPIPVVVDRVHHAHPIFVDAFAYLRDVTTAAIPKITIPGPGMANLMGGPQVISSEAYPDPSLFWDDLVAAYREEVAQLYAAGCRYLQMDDVGFAYLCDTDFRARMSARGEDPDELVIRYRDAMNAVIADRPADLIVSTHMCRGNFRSRWVASGGYEPIAEAIFGGLDVDAFFLEFDSDRSGGFEPLRHLAPGKTAVLGLVTSKTRSWRRRTTCAHASTRPPSSSRSTSSRSARSAASPAATTATTSTKPHSGASSSWCSRSPPASGADTLVQPRSRAAAARGRHAGP